MAMLTILDLIGTRVSEEDFRRFVKSFTAKWVNSNGDKYAKQIADIIKEYALDVDIAGKFRMQWNRSHAPWDRYSNTNIMPNKPNTKLANSVKYQIKNGKLNFTSDIKANPPIWNGDYPNDGDLSAWIEGDPSTGNSYIHPVPPYNVVDGKKIFKAWFEKSEWLNMWYEANPYMRNALNDPRIKDIQDDATTKFAKDLNNAALIKWGRGKLKLSNRKNISIR